MLLFYAYVASNQITAHSQEYGQRFVTAAPKQPHLELMHNLTNTHSIMQIENIYLLIMIVRAVNIY